MGIAQMVWSRICNIGRMLGVIWLCEYNMDTSGHNQLESDFDLELCLYGNRVCGEHCVSSQESVAGGQCHRREDQ